MVIAAPKESSPHRIVSLVTVHFRRFTAPSDSIGDNIEARRRRETHCEALGLTWVDVDADRVHIRPVLVVGVEGKGWMLTEAKTRGSARTVTLPATTMKALATRRGQQEIDKIAAGNAYRDDGFVFAGQTGTPPYLATVVEPYFKPLLKAAGLPNIRLYDLRHTHASLLLAAGVPVNVVSARLGHASAKMTLDIYAHVLSGQQEDAVASLEAYMTTVLPND